MKKIYVFAAVAIAALASCTKSEVVYNQGQQEIGFKAVTGAITKAEQSGTLTGTMGVFAFVNGTSDQVYFKNIEFSGPTTWTGGQYWPLQSSLNFVVYAPHGTASYESKKLTVTGADNTSATRIADQTDYLYGAEYYDGVAHAGYNKTSGQVATSLKHALAKVTLAFKGSNVTVKSVSLVKPTLKGSYSVNYSAQSPLAVWNATAEETDLTLAEFADKTLSNSEQSVSIMVVPADDSDIVITYTIAGNNQNTVLEAKIPLTSTWATGTHYTYNISINPNAIEFSAPTVTGWTENDPDPSGTTIQ